MTTREPRWTEQDRAEVLALAEYREGLCPCCGLPLEETTSPEETGPQFVATRAVCRARLAIAEAQNAIATGKKPTPAEKSRLWSVQKR